MDKIETAISSIEAAVPTLGNRVDIGTISFGCAFGYLDLRFPDLGWRDRHPKSADWYARFGARPSMVATRHPGPV
jgi:glutathione S-transferase